MGYTASVDELQEQFKCCGINGREDWNASEWRNTNGYGYSRVPFSCCRDPGTATTATPTIAPNVTNATSAPNATSATPTNATTPPDNSTLSERRRAIFRRDSPMNTTIGNTTTTPTVEAVCFTNGAYQTGCWEQIYNTLSSYTVHIAGVTIALAVLQVLILAIPIILLVIVIVELRRSKSLEIK